jgi:methionyl-tRNA formyltransferase
MRIAFLGLPLAAVLLHADGHEIAIAGLRPSLTVGARRLRQKIGEDRVVFDPQKNWQAFADRVKEAKAELLVSWFFTRRIPMSVVEACPMGGVGVHPSLLPRHRGPDPFFGAIDAGDDVTGVTAHKIAADYDTGEVVAQRAIALNPEWNAWNLAKALDRPSISLLREVVKEASRTGVLVGTPQDPSLATLAPEPDEEQVEIRWNQPAERIARRIRALSPTPGALAWIGEQELFVTKARVETRVPKALVVGEAAIVDGIAVVRASDTGVALLAGVLDEEEVGAEEICRVVREQQINRP